MATSSRSTHHVTTLRSSPTSFLIMRVHCTQITFLTSLSTAPHFLQQTQTAALPLWALQDIIPTSLAFTITLLCVTESFSMYGCIYIVRLYKHCSHSLYRQTFVLLHSLYFVSFAQGTKSPNLGSRKLIYLSMMRFASWMRCWQIYESCMMSRVFLNLSHEEFRHFWRKGGETQSQQGEATEVACKCVMHLTCGAVSNTGSDMQAAIAASWWRRNGLKQIFAEDKPCWPIDLKNNWTFFLFSCLQT